MLLIKLMSCEHTAYSFWGDTNSDGQQWLAFLAWVVD